MQPRRPSIFRRAATAALFGLLVAPGVAFAAADQGESTPLNFGGSAKAATPHTGSGGASIVRTIVGLAVVIGVIYGLTWVLRQVKASKGASAQGSGLTSVATLPLGHNKALHLVRTGDEVVLVGAGEHGVTPIRTYTVEEAQALGLLALDADDEDDPTSTESRKGGGIRRVLDDLRRRTVIR